MIGIKKDDYRSNSIADHEACGVLDPLDETATSLTGRGKRVTIKGENEKVLADFIIGKEVEGSDGHKFVRIPGQKHVYSAKVDLDLSTTFSDWIEADLLKVDKDKIDDLVIKDYSIDERRGRINEKDNLKLKKDGAGWAAQKMRKNQEVDKTKMNNFLTALDGLSIVGVRPKPAGLSQNLKKSGDGIQISQSDLMSLQSKGYYFTGSNLVSNEGEIQAQTNEGVRYTLRFGEVVYGTGEAISAGSESNSDKNAGPGENRYLFISTNFDESLFAEPKKPSNLEFQTKADSLWSNTDHKNKGLQDAYAAWEQKVENGRNSSKDLNDRFADWYYVISSDSFDKLDLGRSDLIKNKEESK